MRPSIHEVFCPLSVFVVVPACNAAYAPYLLHILGAIPTRLVCWSIKVIVADGSDIKETGELIRQHDQFGTYRPQLGAHNFYRNQRSDGGINRRGRGYSTQMSTAEYLSAAAGGTEAGQAVSVVILTWNSVGNIEPCLESLRRGTLVPNEIIVVDNGSTDQTRAVLARQFPDVRVIENTHNRGVAPARNQGLAVARGAYLIVLDDDTVVHPDALARLVSVLDTNPTVAVCGPQLLDSARQPVDQDRSFPTLWHKARRWRDANPQNEHSSGDGMAGGLHEVDYVIGACHVIRRAALDEIGPYDKHIFYGPEDVDFCLRLHQAGWLVVCEPAARVIHAEQRIARSVSSAIGRKHATGLAYYFRKHRYGLSRKRLYAHLPTNSPASRSH